MGAQIEPSINETYLKPLFQPIVRRDGSIWAYEALMRVDGRRPEKSPASAILRWERSNHIRLIDVLMISKITYALRCVDHRPRICVNVSVKTIESDMEGYFKELDVLAGCARQIIIEITETAPFHNIEIMIRFSKLCRAKGYLLSFDDCKPGHPYSDPKLIRVMQPKILKIDGAFMQSCMAQDHVGGAENIFAAARQIQAIVVVEWVENRTMFEFAWRMGADMFQGYYFGVPDNLPNRT